MMFTLDGVPLLYNGMEVGDASESGDPALFERIPIFWQPKGRPPLREIYKDLIRLRKQSPAFQNDDVVWLRNSDEANLVTFMRRDAKAEFVVVINFSNRPVVGWVEVMHDKEFKQLKVAGATDASDGGLPLFRLGGFDWRIYHRSIAP
jgi:glycosidase